MSYVAVIVDTYITLTLAVVMMDNEVFRFLDLPAEIRNKIYRLLLCNFEVPDDFPDESLPVNLVEVPTEITKAKHDINTAILRVSHRINREAGDILLKENQFVRIEAHFPVLPPAIRSIFIAKRVPIIVSNTEVVNKFKGQVMTYRFEENKRMPMASFTCLILHRDFDLVCRGVAKADTWMPVFASKTRHTLTLHDPYCQSSTDHQKFLLAPFRRHLRGLSNIFIRGNVDPSLAKAVIAEVKQILPEDPDRIIQELRELKDLGTHYLKNGDGKMSSETWAKACIRVESLRTGPSWGALTTNKPFMKDLKGLFFALNLNLAQNSLKAMEQALPDIELVCGIADSALMALQAAFEQLPNDGEWEPTPSQIAKLWFRKAKVHRLCQDYPDAWQAIGFAGDILPNDPMILAEKQHIFYLMN